MLTMTQAAGEYLSGKLIKRRASDEMAVRVLRKPQRRGWMVRLDDRHDDDVTLEHEGRTVLLMDERTSELLTEKVLDVVGTNAGPKLRFRKS